MENDIVDSIASPSIPAIAQPPIYAPWYEVLLDFLASIASSLGWPGAALLIAFLFREQIIAMFDNVESVKVGGVEAKIRRNLKAAAEELRSAEPVAQETASSNDSQFAVFLEMATTSPTGAIVEAWKQVEAVAYDLVAREFPRLREMDRLRPMNSQSLFKHLLDIGALPESELNTFQKLRVIRNQAAHSSDM